MHHLSIELEHTDSRNAGSCADNLKGRRACNISARCAGKQHAAPSQGQRETPCELAGTNPRRYTCIMTPVNQNTESSPKQAIRRRARLDQVLDVNLLKAIGEPTRARLLSCLLKCARPCSVTEVAECCSIDFSMVARHLATMSRAGLLSSQKTGRTVWYAADAPSLAARFRDLADAIDELVPQDGCCKTSGARRPPKRGEAK